MFKRTIMNVTKTILAVDDNPINLGILEEILAGDYRLKFAHSGQEALRLAAQAPPAVVLLDVMMPGMDGLEICRRLREMSGLSHTAIIMVSAKAMPSEREAGFQAGADDYISKPFDEVELLEALRRYLKPASQRVDVLVSDETDDETIFLS
jgi:putative two-component system response regulator